MRRRWMSRLILALMIGLIVYGAVRLWPRDRSLLKRARRIVDMPHWSHFAWVSDHQILVFRDGEAGFELSVVDTVSGRRVLCPRLTALFNADVFAAESDESFYSQVSPDGKRLLWATYEEVQGRPARYWCCCADLDGRLLFKTRIGQDGSSHHGAPNWFYWLSDGRHWAEALRPDDDSPLFFDRLRIRSVERPNEAAVVQLPRNSVDHEISGDLQFAGDRVLVVQAPSEVGAVFTDIIDEYRSGVRVAWINRYSAPPVPHFDGKYAFASVSASGRSVCWQLSTGEPASQIATVLHQWLPGISGGTSRWTGVFVADLQGKTFREEGIMPHVEAGDEPPLRQVTWAPDDRDIGFVYDGNLYVVPVSDADRRAGG